MYNLSGTAVLFLHMILSHSVKGKNIDFSKFCLHITFKKFFTNPDFQLVSYTLHVRVL